MLLVAAGLGAYSIGVLSGPRDVLQTNLLAEAALPQYRTLTFTWLNTCIWTGYGIGTALTGTLTGPGPGPGPGPAPATA